MDLAQALALFLAWVKLHRATNTYLLYRSRLRSLGELLGVRRLDTIMRDDLEAWLVKAGQFPDGRKKAPDTRRANAIALMQFQIWCVDHGQLTAPILAKIEKPAGRERERIPTPEETERLLRDASPAFGRIYKALRQSGARPNEMCKVTISDWKGRPAGAGQAADHGVIELKEHKTAAKTGKPRRIAVGKQLAAIMLESIGERTAGPVFLSPSGKAWRPQRLSAVYRSLRDKAGLAKDLVLYLARHEHGTRICQKLGIKAAADALGHLNIRTTQRYAHSTDAERAAAQDAFE